MPEALLAPAASLLSFGTHCLSLFSGARQSLDYRATRHDASADETRRVPALLEWVGRAA